MGFTIGVIGASGGVGASTLTAALAMRAHTVVDDGQPSLAVDLDVRGGLDTTMCMEHLVGTRWDDIDDHDWPIGPGADRLGLEVLPGEGGVHVLSGRGVPELRSTSILETLEVLVSQASLVAVDCGPRPWPELLARVDHLVVVSRLSPKGMHDAQVLARSTPLERAHPVLVTRGGKTDRSGPSAARQLGLPFLAHLGDDPRVPRQARAGVAPGVVRSAVDAVADEALAMVESAWLQTRVSLLMAAPDPEWRT